MLSAQVAFPASALGAYHHSEVDRVYGVYGIYSGSFKDILSTAGLLEVCGCLFLVLGFGFRLKGNLAAKGTFKPLYQEDPLACRGSMLVRQHIEWLLGV